MKAAILAAGRGTRLGHLTANIPKSLLKINNKPILEYQLKALLNSGIKDVVIVTGYCADQIRRYAGDRCKEIFNENYTSTNSIYSLWLARDELYSHEFALLNSDIIAEESLIIRFMQNSRQRTTSLVDRDKALKNGEMNIVIREGKIVKFSKDVRAAEASGESAQITKFSADDSKLLFNHIERLIKKGHTDKFPAFAYDIILKESVMYPVFTQGKRWVEIDTPEDLNECLRLDIF